MLLRLPLNPFDPEEDQEITSPWRSLIVMMVLLNVDWMCARPDWIFLRTFFLVFEPEYLDIAYFFFLGTILRGPLRVRALVRVR